MVVKIYTNSVSHKWGASYFNAAEENGHIQIRYNKPLDIDLTIRTTIRKRTVAEVGEPG